MDFANTSWKFPIVFKGVVTNGTTQVIMNGPNVGGNVMKNGSYDIPILLNFYISPDPNASV